MPTFDDVAAMALALPRAPKRLAREFLAGA